MTKRKDDMIGFLAPINAPNSQDIVARPSGVRRPVNGLGPTKNMVESIEQLSRMHDETRQMSERILAGEMIVDLATELIDPPFIRDRLADLTEASVEDLKHLIEENGQLSPILVRPHPDTPGRYQLAYGRRRLLAVKCLNRPVKAVIRQLNDEELIRAQGNENLGRKDLTFIEKALFAIHLEDKGISRTTIRTSLGSNESHLSEMFVLARSLPESLIEAIGPAPKIGRGRWTVLAQLLEDNDVDWHSLVTRSQFLALDSDDRFDYVMTGAKPTAPPPKRSQIKDKKGKVVATIDRKGKQFKLIINEAKTPQFGNFIEKQLLEFYASFLRQQETSNA